MPQNSFDDMSALVQVMMAFMAIIWARAVRSPSFCETPRIQLDNFIIFMENLAKSGQCCLRSMLPYDISGPQWFKYLFSLYVLPCCIQICYIETQFYIIKYTLTVISKPPIGSFIYYSLLYLRVAKPTVIEILLTHWRLNKMAAILQTAF